MVLFGTTSNWTLTIHNASFIAEVATESIGRIISLGLSHRKVPSLAWG
jgi:hypothetical protein